MCKWLAKIFPVACFIVEDMGFKTTRKNGRSRAPLQDGKNWFYSEIRKFASLELKQGYETKILRDAGGLSKLKDKLANDFYAHAVDAWALANSYTNGFAPPDNTRLLIVRPLQSVRRRLHYLQPEPGGVRGNFGGTRRLNFKKGSLVKHIRFGTVTYVGGYYGKRLTLFSFSTVSVCITQSTL